MGSKESKPTIEGGTGTENQTATEAEYVRKRPLGQHEEKIRIRST